MPNSETPEHEKPATGSPEPHARNVSRLLFSIADAVNTTFDLDDLYRQIHLLLGEAIDATNFFIALVNLKKKTIHFPYFVDITDDDYTDICDFDTSRSLTGIIALAKRPMLLKEAELRAREKQSGILGTTPLIWMGVPLIVRDEVIGVVAVQSYSDPTAYDEDDLHLLAAVSHQIALAIDRKLSLDELRRSEERYRLLFDNLHDALFLIDKDGKIIEHNPRVLEMSGYTPDELSEISFFDLITSEDRALVAEKLNDFNSTDHNLIQTSLISQDGRTLNAELSSRLTHVSGSDLIQIIVRDITEEKLAQDERARLTEKLQRSKRMEAIGLLAGGVAHDLNNILSGIVNYPELMLLSLNEDHKLVPYVHAIHTAGLRAAQVVDDLLTIARGAATLKEIHDLHTIVREYIVSPECMVLKSHYPEIVLQTRLQAKNTSIRCSTIHIKKVLMNLVNNAMEAMSDRGTVTLRTMEGAQVGRDMAAPGETSVPSVILQIIDDGPGIAEKDMEHIFEPFYTRKVMGRSGTGLGLTVVWNTMEDHGGEVQVESSPEGTTFSLLFPISTSPPAVPAMTDTTELRGQGESILIVDDEPQNLDIALQILSALGYRCRGISSGEEAIELLRTQDIDLVILDMVMGNGLNGRETYEEIVTFKPTQKAVIATGYSDSDEVDRALQLGVRGIIKKPFTTPQLSVILRAALGEACRPDQ